MNSTDNIKNLREQIEEEQRKIRNCKHDFGKPFYNAETVREAYGYRMVAQGSDVWGEPEGYRDVKKDRWTRKCTLCGCEEHTRSTKPIISGYEPNF
jgi:hypothetical protein